MQIYLIATIRGQHNEILRYRVTDIDSREVKEVTVESLTDAIKNNEWAFKNIGLAGIICADVNKYSEEYSIIAKEGINEIPRVNEIAGKVEPGKQYVLISIDLIKNTAKLVNTNGNFISIDIDSIYNYGRDIAGVLSGYNNEYRKLIQTVPTEEEKRLLVKTTESYKEFILKTRALGMDCSFRYDVCGNAVILESYTGSSKHAIVPKFIDVIDADAFNGRYITDLSLNDGLKVIGYKAFTSNNLSEVDIPKTVTRICKYAFYRNGELFNRVERNGKYVEISDKDKFRVHSKNTIISDQTKNS